jgi:anti-sigma factor RsiW
MPCPDCETLSAFADGQIEPPARAEIERHLSVCAPCCELVAEMRSLNSLGRASFEAIRLPPRPERMMAIESGSKRRLFRVPALAAAAVLLVSAAAALVARWTEAVRSKPVMASTRPPAKEKYVPPTDAEFETWAAPYLKLHIPLVPMEDVATYRPPQVFPILPESPMDRNHS